VSCLRSGKNHAYFRHSLQTCAHLNS